MVQMLGRSFRGITRGSRTAVCVPITRPVQNTESSYTDQVLLVLLKSNLAGPAHRSPPQQPDTSLTKAVGFLAPGTS